MNQRAPLRTVKLRERVSRECRLSSADAAFLLVEHRPHVQLGVTGRRGRYQLTPTGHVGTIIGPGCRLVIRPKIPVRNLAHLLDPAGPLPAADDRVTPVQGDTVLDLLAGRLARLLEERATAGLHRAYAERSEEGQFLHGRLDLPAQLRDQPGRKDRLHCRYEDFTTDVPCNQLARATAELVLRSPLLGDSVQQALRQALQGYADVTPAVLGPDLLQAAEPTGLTEGYRPLFELCRLLAEGLNPGEKAGATPCPAFLLDMERVFENYCVSSCVKPLHTGQGAYGKYIGAIQSLHRFGDLEMRPDLVLRQGEIPVLVLDAKWKKDAVQQDIYQVLAYCAVLGGKQAMLVYPGRRDGKRSYRFERAGITLTLRKLRVVGTRSECRRSAERLARSVLLAAMGGE
jgi:5-methylcytosine-specific restriction enzyme subunit McrC